MEWTVHHCEIIVLRYFFREPIKRVQIRVNEYGICTRVYEYWLRLIQITSSYTHLYRRVREYTEYEYIKN